MVTATKHSIEEDFAAWAEQTADLLEQRRFGEVNLAELVEEVRGLARSDRRAVENQLLRLFAHLLKWCYQPERRGRSWQLSIFNARNRLARLVKESPSLRGRLTPETLEEIWVSACKYAALETGLDRIVFPERCPWDLDSEVLNQDWLPGAISA